MTLTEPCLWSGTGSSSSGRRRRRRCRLLALFAEFAHDLCDVDCGGHLGLLLHLQLPEDDGAQARPPVLCVVLQLGVTGRRDERRQEKSQGRMCEENRVRREMQNRREEEGDHGGKTRYFPEEAVISELTGMSQSFRLREIVLLGTDGLLQRLLKHGRFHVSAVRVLQKCAPTHHESAVIRGV